jgi:chitodextrinase
VFLSSARARALRYATAITLVAALVVISTPADAADPLLSRGKPAVSSSDESAGLAAGLAVDGNPATRWASADGADPQWIRVDLGASATITRVRIAWEAAYAKAYRIDLSSNGSTWTTLYSTTSGNGATDDLTGLSGSGRYVRVYGTARATAWGYSLFELEVFGTGAGDTQPPAAPTNLRGTGVTANSAALAWDAATDNTGVTGYHVLRNNVIVGSTATTTFTDTGLAAATTYHYTVKAKDAAGNDSPASNQVSATTQAGGGATTRTIVAAGDIAQQCTAAESACAHPKTAARVEAINPDLVLTMGDSQYDDGTWDDYTKYYDKTWGRFKAKTRPVPGNHDTYDDAGFEYAYKRYFGTLATPQGKTFYSFDTGNWHFVALDSNLPLTAGSEQIAWLKADLAAHHKGCVAAYWHHPLFSSGGHGNDPVSKLAWQELYKAKADLILNGHDHHYERFAPQDPAAKADPDGIVEIVGGMAGASPYDIENVQPNSQFRLSGTYGVLKLSLTDTTFSWQLVQENGQIRDTSPTYTCH